ncbi:T9SS type A sorting domain-containing protein [Paramyrothecium foliicola]|nr:T9SS type A sorting domain-containing protein [Paramyrothecium foliicola]
MRQIVHFVLAAQSFSVAFAQERAGNTVVLIHQIARQIQSTGFQKYTASFTPETDRTLLTLLAQNDYTSWVFDEFSVKGPDGIELVGNGDFENNEYRDECWSSALSPWFILGPNGPCTHQAAVLPLLGRGWSNAFIDGQRNGQDCLSQILRTTAGITYSLSVYASLEEVSEGGQADFNVSSSAFAPPTGLFAHGERLFDGFTNSRRASVTGLGAPRQEIKVYVNGIQRNGGYTDSNGHFDLRVILNAGSNSITASAVLMDQETEKSTAHMVTYLEPRELPAPTLESDSDTGNKGDGVTSAKILTFSGLADPNTMLLIWEESSGVQASTMTSAFGYYSVQIGPLPAGIYHFLVEDQDLAGNRNRGLSSPVMVVDVPEAPSLALGNGQEQLDAAIDTRTSIYFSSTAIPGNTLVIYEDDIAISRTTVSRNGSAIPFFEIPPRSAGPHTFKATQMDLNGEVSLPSNTFTIIVRLVPPTLTGVQGHNGTLSTITENDVPTFIGTSIADALITIYDEAGNRITSGFADASGGFALPASRAFPAGTYSFTADAAMDEQQSSRRSNIFQLTVVPISGTSSTSTTSASTFGTSSMATDMTSMLGSPSMTDTWARSWEATSTGPKETTTDYQNGSSNSVVVGSQSTNSNPIPTSKPLSALETGSMYDSLNPTETSRVFNVTTLGVPASTVSSSTTAVASSSSRSGSGTSQTSTGSSSSLPTPNSLVSSAPLFVLDGFIIQVAVPAQVQNDGPQRRQTAAYLTLGAKNHVLTSSNCRDSATFILKSGGKLSLKGTTWRAIANPRAFPSLGYEPLVFSPEDDTVAAVHNSFSISDGRVMQWVNNKFLDPNHVAAFCILDGVIQTVHSGTGPPSCIFVELTATDPAVCRTSSKSASTDMNTIFMPASDRLEIKPPSPLHISAEAVGGHDSESQTGSSRSNDGSSSFDLHHPSYMFDSRPVCGNIVNVVIYVDHAGIPISTCIETTPLRPTTVISTVRYTHDNGQAGSKTTKTNDSVITRLPEPGPEETQIYQEITCCPAEVHPRVPQPYATKKPASLASCDKCSPLNGKVFQPLLVSAQPMPSPHRLPDLHSTITDVLDVHVQSIARKKLYAHETPGVNRLTAEYRPNSAQAAAESHEGVNTSPAAASQINAATPSPRPPGLGMMGKQEISSFSINPPFAASSIVNPSVDSNMESHGANTSTPVAHTNSADSHSTSGGIVVFISAWALLLVVIL